MIRHRTQAVDVGQRVAGGQRLGFGGVAADDDVTGGCIINRCQVEVGRGRHVVAAVGDYQIERHCTIAVGDRCKGPASVAMVGERAIVRIDADALHARRVADVAGIGQQLLGAEDIGGIFTAIGQGHRTAHQRRGSVEGEGAAGAAGGVASRVAGRYRHTDRAIAQAGKIGAAVDADDALAAIAEADDGAGIYIETGNRVGDRRFLGIGDKGIGQRHRQVAARVGDGVQRQAAGGAEGKAIHPEGRAPVVDLQPRDRASRGIHGQPGICWSPRRQQRLPYQHARGVVSKEAGIGGT
ncbi:hypothetical protein D9M71_192070 [compost metagenome]